MTTEGLSRRALLGGGLARVRERFDREAPAPAPDPEARRRASARAFWEAGDDPRVADWCAPVAPALLDALDTAAPGSHVVDLGAGRGDLAHAAAARGLRVTAVDHARTVMDRGRPSLTWVRADLARLPLPDDAADVVVSWFGLVYAADMRAATDEVRRVLRPGGQVAVATWDSTGAMGALLRLARRADPSRFGRTRPERWGGYDGLLLAFDRFDAFAMDPRELIWRAPDRDALWDALTAPPGPLSRGELTRSDAEDALAPHLRETSAGVELAVGWLLVTAQG